MLALPSPWQSAQDCWSGGVVFLHCLSVSAHHVVAGSPLGHGDLVGDRKRRSGDHHNDATKAEDRSTHTVRSHSTVIEACSVTAKPLSPVQVKVSVPLWVATVWNAMKGFAEIAGKRSA